MRTTFSRLSALGVLAGIVLGGSEVRPYTTVVTGTQVADAGWPRKVTSADGTTVTVYQPQIERWDANRLEARAAVAVQSKAAAEPTYGVVWITARTEVDKEHRLVTLEDLKATKTTFPGAPDKAEDYLALVRTLLPAGARVVALDRLEANLAVTQAELKTSRVTVKNEPPRVIVSTKPALLILVDGKPALRQVDGSDLLRVINTRALILLDQAKGNYYLRLMDRWMTAAEVDGTWSLAKTPPASLEKVLKKFTDDPQVDLLDKLADDLTDAFESGVIPVVYVSTVPAELIEIRGEPDLAPIDGTKLMWVKNTTDELLLDSATGNYYVLFSGRWFRARSLKGPWEFVSPDSLPPDFAKVPETHPRGDVLSSVAGTPQAEEAVIANHIPTTAEVKRSEAKLTVNYDGEPKFEPIEETKLMYAANSPTPVIRVAADQYYAVENGVWFTATSPSGPWTVATSVPSAVYAMPPSSPIYYVTYVQVYGSTPEAVYVGYTPGYFGTCVAPQNVVVYGTGWNFAPWVGKYWYGRPWTYGFGTHFGYTSAGWGFGYGCAASRPWWGPAGWHAGYGGTAWRDGWKDGYGGRYSNTHINNVNFGNFNAYNRWGDNVRVNHLGNTTVNKTTNINNVQRGFNNVMSTRDGNIVRHSSEGWERNEGNEWKRYDPAGFPADRRPEVEKNIRQLDNDWGARRTGEANTRDFRNTAGHEPARPEPGGYRPDYGGRGGFNPQPGGYRGGGGNRGGGRRR